MIRIQGSTKLIAWERYLGKFHVAAVGWQHTTVQQQLQSRQVGPPLDSERSYQIF